MPEPTVCATAVPNPNAATKLKKAAQTTALPGLRTRVDTTVAIEFAASWKAVDEIENEGDGNQAPALPAASNPSVIRS